MLSVILSDSLCDIEIIMVERAEDYGTYKDHIEIVKAAMETLMLVLQSPPQDCINELTVADTLDLTDDRREWWQVTCEANIERWIKCLQLLGPVTAEELVLKLADAIERQNAMLE